MTIRQLSESTEMYLKTMAELGMSDRVAVGRLARRLGVTPVSANEMVRRLSDQGFVKHTPYKGAALTHKGRRAASDVVRRQMLWECFLYDHLKIEWSQVYELACGLEHATAPEVTDALAAFLGGPERSPYGDRIPSSNEPIEPLKGKPLSTAAVGETVRIYAVRAASTEVFKHLQERDLLPGREVTIMEAEPMQGPLTLRVGARDVTLGLSIAEFVIVETMPHK